MPIDPTTTFETFRREAAAASTPEALARSIAQRTAGGDRPEVWIERLDEAALLPQARALFAARDAGRVLPLFGLPLGVKDNIDVAGVPTTAGCPSYAYTPAAHAGVIERLTAAGAIVAGKTNLDQFATGLVGTRSPYGPVRNIHDPRYVSGGSSSGSAVSVAAGMTAFALGTDTAGSGRVPAAFNTLVGLKPTRGVLSMTGVVPACRSLDCVSIFTRTCGDALAALESARGFDPADAYSRPMGFAPRPFGTAFRFGVPRAEQLEFFGDEAAHALFEGAIARLQAIGGTPVEFDYTPFGRTAQLLYGGAWVAERTWAVGKFLESNPPDADPTVRQIILNGAKLSACDAFDGLYKLEQARRETAGLWESIDVMLLPTTGTIYRIDEVQADPIRLNSNLGHYTNFVNLLDLAAIAIPAGVRAAGEKAGLPFGVSLIGPAFSDRELALLGGRFMGEAITESYTEPFADGALLEPAENEIELVVCGAHMRGLALNHQLATKGARFLGATKTAPHYRLFALPGGKVPRPALVHRAGEGAALECEVWGLTPAALGRFMTEVLPPLAIGTVELADGRARKGFVSEPRALEGAADITDLGGWRAYLRTLKG